MNPNDVTGLVLSGGRGTRMGGIDKGLLPYQGQALALHVLLRLRAQTGHAAISANRHLEAYREWGVPVWADDPITSGPESASMFQDPCLAPRLGPLAGVATALGRCSTPWLLVAPCDAPLLPLDLGARLYAALQAQGAPVAVARSVGPACVDGRPAPLQQQPVFCLLSTELQHSAQRFLMNAGRAMSDWLRQHPVAWADFDRPDDDPLAFCNINAAEDLQWLTMTGPPRTRP